MSNKIRTTIVLDAPLAEQARQIAVAKGGNLSRYINDLLKKDIHGPVGDMLTDEPSAALGSLHVGIDSIYKKRNDLYVEKE